MKKYSGEEFLKKVYKDLASSDEVRRAVTRYNAANSDNQKRGGADVEAIYAYLNRQGQLLDRMRLKSGLVKEFFYDRYVIKEYEVPNGQDADRIIREQKSSLDEWLLFLASEEAECYPTWFKYFCFQGMVRLCNDCKSIGNYKRRILTNSTTLSGRKTVSTQSFIELNADAIDMMYNTLMSSLEGESVNDQQLEMLINGGSFSKLYSYFMKKLTFNSNDEAMSNEGIWKKYNQGSNSEELFNDIRGKRTYWCTADGLEIAKSQLDAGDFYVYYTKDKNGEYTMPRIAIKTVGGKIHQIRGIANSQNVEHCMETVVQAKLKEFPNEDEFKNIVDKLVMLTNIYTKWQNDNDCELTREELLLLYGLDGEIICLGFGSGSDPRVLEILETRNKKKDLSIAFEISEDQICMTEELALNNGCNLYYGDLDLIGLESASCLELPRIIIGSLDIGNLKNADNLKLPEKVSGYLFLHNLNEARNVTLPEFVGGCLYLNKLTSAEGLIIPEQLNCKLVCPLANDDLNTLREMAKSKKK